MVGWADNALSAEVVLFGIPIRATRDNSRIVGNSSLIVLWKGCPSSGKWGPLIVVNRPITLHKPIQGYRSVAVT